MKLTCLTSILAISVSLVADGETNTDAAKSGADEISTAMVDGKFDRVIALTYPKLVDAMGGKDAALDATKKQMSAMKDQGVKIVSCEADDPGEVISGGGKDYCVVPTEMVLKTPKAKVTVKSYFLAISSDKGKSWTYIDGSGLTDEMKGHVLPDLPSTVKLPAKQEPSVEKTDDSE